LFANATSNSVGEVHLPTWCHDILHNDTWPNDI
jgi:hypothetical protein